MNGNGNQNHRIRCGTKTYTVLLCSRGRELHDHWTALMEKNADPAEIYNAMQAYFEHKNGVRSRCGETVIAPCPNCRTIAGPRVEQFERQNDGNPNPENPAQP